MRHGIVGKRFGRNSSWRKATVRDIAKATLMYQRIKTTEVKAKEARKLVDKLITLGKKGTLAHKRRAFAILCDHKLVSTLFDKIAIRFRSRNGGYTRIIKLAQNRLGDNARMVFLELTEKEQAPLVKERKAKKKSVKEPEVEAATETEAGAPEKEKEVHAEKKTSQQRPERKVEKKRGTRGGLTRIFRRKTGE